METLWKMLEILTQVIFEVGDAVFRSSGIGTQFYAIEIEMLSR